MRVAAQEDAPQYVGPFTYLELVTKKPGVARGTGANRPTPTIVRYRRRVQSEHVAATDPATAAEGCPVH